jgi:hypothetical protein
MVELCLYFSSHNFNHLSSCPMDTGENSPEAKRLGRETDDSPSPSAEAKNGGAIPPLLLANCIDVWC